MKHNATYSCDECGKPATYLVNVYPHKRHHGIGGAAFDLCEGCVLNKTYRLPRETGDLLPKVPDDFVPTDLDYQLDLFADEPAPPKPPSLRRRAWNSLKRTLFG